MSQEKLRVCAGKDKSRPPYLASLCPRLGRLPRQLAWQGMPT